MAQSAYDFTSILHPTMRSGRRSLGNERTRNTPGPHFCISEDLIKASSRRQFWHGETTFFCAFASLSFSFLFLWLFRAAEDACCEICIMIPSSINGLIHSQHESCLLLFFSHKKMPILLEAYFLSACALSSPPLLSFRFICTT